MSWIEVTIVGVPFLIFALSALVLADTFRTIRQQGFSKSEEEYRDRDKKTIEISSDALMGYTKPEVIKILGENAKIMRLEQQLTSKKIWLGTVVVKYLYTCDDPNKLQRLYTQMMKLATDIINQTPEAPVDYSAEKSEAKMRMLLAGKDDPIDKERQIMIDSLFYLTVRSVERQLTRLYFLHEELMKTKQPYEFQRLYTQMMKLATDIINQTPEAPVDYSAEKSEAKMHMLPAGPAGKDDK